MCSCMCRHLYSIKNLTIILWLILEDKSLNNASSLLLFQGKFYIQAPMIIFGVLSAAAGLLVLLLPETLNRRQPQTIEEAEQMACVGHNDKPDNRTL